MQINPFQSCLFDPVTLRPFARIPGFSFMPQKGQSRLDGSDGTGLESDKFSDQSERKAAPDLEQGAEATPRIVSATG